MNEKLSFLYGFWSKKEVHKMDVSTRNVKKLFEKQITELTKRTCNILPKEELFDLQMSGGWLR